MLLQRIFDRPLQRRDRVTATEMIEGTQCLIVLEQDVFGRYRETLVSPMETRAAEDEDLYWPVPGCEAVSQTSTIRPTRR